MNINGVEVIDRANRPSVNSKVALRALFQNDGLYQDPVFVSGVSVFKESQTITPNTVLGEDGLIDPAVSGSILAHFEFSESAQGWDSADNYNEDITERVFRQDQGQFVCVLDGEIEWSGTNTFFGTNLVIPNQCSAIGEYFEVWTVKNLQGSFFSTFIQKFELFDNAFIHTPEPPLLRTSHRCNTKKIQLGSKRDIKVTTTVSIENRNIEADIKALLKQGFIRNPALRITKLNSDRNLPARVEVSGFSDTSGAVDITSDSTITFSWDTESLRTHPELLAGNLGSMTGIYEVQAQFDLLTERILTQRFAVQLV